MLGAHANHMLGAHARAFSPAVMYSVYPINSKVANIIDINCYTGLSFHFRQWEMGCMNAVNATLDMDCNAICLPYGDGASFRPEPWAVPGGNDTLWFRSIKNLDAIRSSVLLARQYLTPYKCVFKGVVRTITDTVA